MPDSFYRVILYDPAQTQVFKKGGALYVPREYQGEGRHDLPEDGVLYGSVEPVSAICESLKRFRNLKLDNRDFARPDGQRLALVRFALEKPRLVDLRDAKTLVKLSLKPAEVATLERKVTQHLSKSLYASGVDGFFWWSSLEAKWSNVTLFFSRVAKRLSVVELPVVLETGNSVVKEAAARMNVGLK